MIQAVHLLTFLAPQHRKVEVLKAIGAGVLVILLFFGFQRRITSNHFSLDQRFDQVDFFIYELVVLLGDLLFPLGTALHG